MTEPETAETEPTTAWHPMLVALLECYLPDGWRLQPELLLTRLPQRVDIVVVRLVAQPAGIVRKIHSIFDYLRPHTLIEHKGPTDDLQGGDALTLLGYAAQYMRMNKLSDPAELCLMVVADHIPPGFVKQVERMRGKLEKAGGGLWRGEIAGLPLHGVETYEAYRTGTTERLLYAFSRAYLTHASGVLPLDGEESRVYSQIYQQVEQFRKLRGDVAVKDMDELERNYQEVMQQLLAKMPLEERFKGATPEMFAKVLTPEQIAAALPEMLTKMLTPEQLVAVIDALPPEVREQIKRRQH